MEFLKEILGEALYAQLEEKLNAHNGNEANKDNQVKLANLSTGGYVSKDKYTALETSLTGKQTELDTANNLIAELKKGTKGNEELQSKITGYTQQVEQLQKQLADTRMKAAIKVGLLAEKVKDVDYVTFKLEQKLKEENKALELDENDNIKGWKEYVDGLKTQLPDQFKGDPKPIVEPNRLPKEPEQKPTEPQSLADAIKAKYEAK